VEAHEGAGRKERGVGERERRERVRGTRPRSAEMKTARAWFCI